MQINKNLTKKCVLVGKKTQKKTIKNEDYVSYE